MVDNPVLFYGVWIAIAFTITSFLIAMVILMERLKSEQATKALKSTIEEQERMMKAISEEVHDNFNQMLNLAVMSIHMIPETKDNLEYKTNSIQILKTLIADAQYISRSLNSELLKRTGLKQSLNQIALWVNLSKKIECTVTITGKKTESDPETELMAVRITQEAINNAIKYARAKNLGITLHYGEQNMQLTILDDGLGFDFHSGDFKEGVGIQSMRQRASVIQGTLEIISKKGFGTTIKLTVPK